MRQLVPGFFLVFALLAVACGPYLPPTVVPPAALEFEPLRLALQRYLDQTQQYRREAAAQGQAVPNQTTSPGQAVEALRVREQAIATAIRTNVRPGARVGDVLAPSVADYLREQIRLAFESPRAGLLRDELAEQLEGRQSADPLDPLVPVINQSVDAPRIPPMLVELLPRLPEQLAFSFQERTLILRDVDANIVVDMVQNAFPEVAMAAPAHPAQAPSGPGASTAVLPMPEIRGLTVFAAIGDSGTGDTAQHDVAEAMVRYFTTGRRFAFVLMLGDNLYGNDYNGEFAVPYKDLHDRGVTFHATLGNHDRDAQIHYKPFNMGDRTHYMFTRGNARFVAIDSNEPGDPEQHTWIDSAFADAGTRWRIAFFHHPPYSSGEHEQQGREVIRPALEGVLIRNNVNVVFSGHEHLYERVAPQRGVRYFVSGGGGRRLYGTRRAEFDEYAESTLHFMVLGIVDDRMFFEAIGADDRVIDCGLLWRTPDAEARGPDAGNRAWLDRCKQARPAVPTGSAGSR